VLDVPLLTPEPLLLPLPFLVVKLPMGSSSGLSVQKSKLKPVMILPVQLKLLVKHLLLVQLANYLLSKGFLRHSLTQKGLFKEDNRKEKQQNLSQQDHSLKLDNNHLNKRSKTVETWGKPYRVLMKRLLEPDQKLRI